MFPCYLAGSEDIFCSPEPDIQRLGHVLGAILNYKTIKAYCHLWYILLHIVYIHCSSPALRLP